MYIYGDNKNNLINANKGLPKGQDVYNVDFTKAKYVKDVSDQGDYLGGCPTTGNVNVLVLPIEFSDKQVQMDIVLKILKQHSMVKKHHLI